MPEKVTWIIVQCYYRPGNLHGQGEGLSESCQGGAQDLHPHLYKDNKGKGSMWCHSLGQHPEAWHECWTSKLGYRNVNVCATHSRLSQLWSIGQIKWPVILWLMPQSSFPLEVSCSPEESRLLIHSVRAILSLLVSSLCASLAPAHNLNPHQIG